MSLQNDMQQQILCPQTINQSVPQISQVNKKVLNCVYKIQVEQLERIQPQQKKNNIEICLNSQNIYKKGELMHIENFIYKPGSAFIDQFHFHINKQKINLCEIYKIKIYPNKISTKYYEIKLTLKDNVHYFAAQIFSKQSIYPEHFQWFKFLIISRLQSTSVKLLQKQTPELQAFTLNTSIQPVFIKGCIIKKSKYLKKWQKRFVVISLNGLYSFKDPTDSNYSYFIKSNSITQIWTRFDLIQDNKYIILKLMHADHQKVEFGIPVYSLQQQKQQSNWLYQFYRMMQQGTGIKLQN